MSLGPWFAPGLHAQHRWCGSLTVATPTCERFFAEEALSPGRLEGYNEC
jgi:hypothetical protein